MIRVFRPIVNFLLGIGYVLGLLLVWIGLEALTIDRGEIVLALFNISGGVILWVLLNGAGRLWILSFLQKERGKEL